MAKQRRQDLSEFTERFGQRLAALREEKGWTQETLAAKVERGATWIAKLETGVAMPSFKLLHALSAALGVPAKELFNYDDSPWRGTDWEQNTRQIRAHLESMSAKDAAVLLEVARRFGR